MTTTIRPSSLATIASLFACILFIALAVAPLSARAAGAGPRKPDLSQPHAPDRVIVKLEQGDSNESAAAQALANAGVKRVRRMRQVGVVVAELAKGRGVAQALAALAQAPGVEYVEPDYLVSIDETVPGDPSYFQLWGMETIHAPAGWDVATGDPSIIVAVIDTGIDPDHRDLAANVWTNPGEIPNGLDDDGNGYVDDLHGIDAITGSGDPFDDHGHGTHVSGTIGAAGDNGVGVVGVNWDTRIIGCKFLDADGSGYGSDAVECLDYLLLMKTSYGVDIRLSNNSWGGGGYSQALHDAIAAAGDAGMLFVAAAGNDGRDTDASPHYPSSYELPNVISVAATDSSDQVASFSNTGATSVDLGAPGVAILSTLPGNRYASWSGTSMATPHVAGAAALVWATDPSLDALKVKARLLDTAMPIPALAGRSLSGTRLDLAGAVLCQPGTTLLFVDQPLEDFTVILGNETSVVVRLSNCGTPVLGATVTVTTELGGSFTARDDGVAPDAVADDGRYTALWQPTVTGAESLEIQAIAGSQVLGALVSGQVVVMPDYAIEEVGFAWIDPTPGTQLPLAADDGSLLIPIGFSFPFYGERHDTVRVSSNGYLTFGSFGSNLWNQSLPSVSLPNDVIAVYWDDLSTSSRGSIHARLVGDAPMRQLVIGWLGVPYYSTGGSVSFEVVLRETGEIRFNYLDTAAGVFQDLGRSATVGIEDASGLQGLQYSHNQAVIASESSLRIYDAQACSRADADADADGVCDAVDNCLGMSNPAQRDSDLDGFGNMCDGDFDNNGVVNSADFSDMFVPDFQSGTDGGAGTDMDGNGVVNPGDFVDYFMPSFQRGTPGPSALICAGTVPCQSE